MQIGQENKNQRSSQRDKGRSILLDYFYYLLVVIFLGVVGYIFLFSPFIRVESIYLSGVEELDYKEVKSNIDTILEEKIIGIISKNNIALLSSKIIEDRLKEKYKKIKSVEVEKKFPDTFLIKIEERKAVLVWCEWDNCYVVDDDGIAYIEADFNSPEIVENKLIAIRDGSNKDVNLGDKVLNADFIEFLVDVRDKLEKDLSVKIKGEFKTPNSISGDFRVETEEGWWIYLNKDLGPEKEVQMLKIVLEKNIERDNLKDIEYIDLRTEDKVYYKFREKEEEVVDEGDNDESSN